MPRRVPSARSALVGLALLSALALVGLSGWWLSRSAPGRGLRSAAPAAPSTPAPRADDVPDSGALQPAPAAARSDLPLQAQGPSAEARAARLIVRVTRAQVHAGEVTVTLVQGGGRSASEYRLAPEASTLELPCPAGDVQVSARGSGPPRLVSLPVHATLQPGASELVELVLAPEALFSATLQDEAERRLEGLEVQLRRRKETLASARSDAAGRVVLAPLPAGEYELVLGDLEGPLRPPETLVLAPGDPPRTLVLPVLLALELRVLDGDGQPAPGVRLEGTGKPGGRLQGLTDDAGRLRIERLPPGDYRVFARHATLGRATRALALDARTSADTHELTLRR